MIVNTNITMENLSQFEQAFDQNPVNAVAMNAVTAELPDPAQGRA